MRFLKINYCFWLSLINCDQVIKKFEILNLRNNSGHSTDYKPIEHQAQST